MILQQYYLKCLAHASYLVGDEASRTAAVVDPQRDIGQYLDDAKAHGLEIRHVFLTHFHADFLAGHLELRDLTGASIHLGARAKAEYAFVAMKDGDAVQFGNVRLRVLETPGHSPESISIVVYDLARDPIHPHAVLTGDTLFVGDVGRPDLRASLGFSATELAGLLYDSLREKLLALPDDTLVYPTHGAGSLCGKSISSETVSTIGIQRQYNYALQPMSREDFIKVVNAEQPDAPPYFTYDAILNTKERPTLDRTLESALKPLPLSDVLAMRDAGAQVLDVRDASEFTGAHLTGSVNIGLDGQFATWAGTILGRSAPIVIVASPGREREAAMRLGRIGFDHVAGFLDGGMTAVEQHPEHLQHITRLTATTIAEMLASPHPPVLIDVRTPAERQAKQIDGSLHFPLNHLRERIDEIPRDRPLVVHCAGGYRSSIAASLLEQRGLSNVSDLLGGIAAWETSGFPIVRPNVAGVRTMRPSDYSERIVEVAEWPVRLTTYSLGSRYYCKADNLNPGACIARVEGASREDVERDAIGRAAQYLSRTRRFGTRWAARTNPIPDSMS